MIRRIRIWFQRRYVKKLTIMLYHSQHSRVRAGDPKWGSNSLEYDLEIARLRLACLEDWGKGFPIARKRKKKQQ
jgi:hypothetical protein